MNDGIRKWIVPAALLLVLMLALPMLTGAGKATAAPTGPRTLPADSVPAEVRNGQAKLLGPHNSTDHLLVLFMLPLRDKAGLDAFLADVSNPASSNYGHYLTEAEVTARFGPDAIHAQNVEAWLRANGITYIETPADRLYVLAHADAATLGRMLSVQINDYSVPGRSFYAPDRAPTLPAAVSGDVEWVVGLDSDSQIHSYAQKGPQSAARGSKNGPQSSAPYYPNDFQYAYNTKPLLNGGFTGAGVNVAITLWTQAPTDTVLNGWSATTGSPVATRGNGRLQEILTDGSPSGDTDDGEAALDIESSSGMAPAATIRYYEATQPQNANLAHALDIAGSDPNNRIISNSWGEPENTSARSALESILATHSASGHSYLFSSGDDGSWANYSDPYPDYPTASAYVVSIGGTRFIGNINMNWPGERTWDYNPTGNNGHPEGSGGGYSLYAGRPSWQNGPGIGGTQRAYPDISANADPGSGAYICSNYYGCSYTWGGTSLAAPLWAGMLAITDQYVVANAKPHLGFFAPTVYDIFTHSQTYAPFHDITVGTNGAYNAGPNWDAVTGVGSPDLWNLARDLGGVTLPPTATPTFVVGQHFSDVPPTNPFYDQINWCADHGIVSGYANGDGTYRYLPGGSATRAQISKIIVIAAGWAIDTSGGPHFADVSTSNPFYGVIETAYNHGAISGYSDHTFRPFNSVTRAQFSKIIVIAKSWAIDTSGGPHFTDVTPSNPFYGVIETAYNHGIISGYSDHTFRPNNNITRGQLAKLIFFSFGP